MVPVLMLFLIPFGPGIPAGVLLARSKGLPWTLTAGLYLLSDVLLALAFEPMLRGLVALGARAPWLARFGAAMKESMDRTAAHFNGAGGGPFALLMIAFGVDPMTGRAAALTAGHGFMMGWAFAIAGDMLYYGLIAITTLQLSAYIKNPGTTEWIVLGAMIVMPMAVRAGKKTFRRVRGT